MEDKLNNVTNYKPPKHFNYEMFRWLDILLNAQKRIKSFIEHMSYGIQLTLLGPPDCLIEHTEFY